MSDHRGICEATGVQSWRWAKYAEQARQYLSNNQKPRIIDEADLIEGIRFVQESPNAICETADGRAKAALVLGYVTQAESIDQSIPETEVREAVVRDYHAFRHLVPLTAESSFNGVVARFANDVKDVTSYFFSDHRFIDGPTADQEAILRDVESRVRDPRVKGKKVVVFDVDDTLASPHHREHRLLNEHLENFLKTNPGVLSEREIALIRSIKPEQLSYDVGLDLQVTFGITNKAFLDAWKPYFLSHFFRSDYCKDDSPYPGAAEYVQRLYKAGATIVYFTGRHEKGKLPGTEEGMRAGTVEFLQRNGFPVPNGRNVHLIMKPNFEDDDMAYKAATLAQIKAMGTFVAAFDNEPVAGGLFTEAGASAVVDIGMVQAQFYKGKFLKDGKKAPIKTLQDVPFEPETVVRINDFRRLQTKPKEAVRELISLD